MDIDGYSYGGHIAEWLSRVLQSERLDLVVFESDLQARRIVEANAKNSRARDADQTVYADYSPFMLMGEQSLAALNARLADESKKQVTVRNFRPNFLVKGCEAFDENKWSAFRIIESDASSSSSSVQFVRIRQCTRCLLTTVDPDTGEKDAQREPFETLKKYTL
jgi:uncharacterized protein YcbX